MIGCPNCGGRIELHDDGDRARCPFCASEFAIPQGRSADTPPSTPLAPRDLILPTLGCVAVYAVVFMVVSLLVAAFGLQEAARSRGVIALMAVVAGVLVFVRMLRARTRGR